MSEILIAPSELEVLNSLSSAIEKAHLPTYQHSENVSSYAEAMGRFAGLPQREIELLKRAGRIHDIGKIRPTILLLLDKPELTDEEFAEVKKHTLYGVETDL